MSPTVEEVETDRGELSDPSSRASSDAETLGNGTCCTIEYSYFSKNSRNSHQTKIKSTHSPNRKQPFLSQGNPLYLPFKRRRKAFWEILPKTTCLLVTKCPRRSNLSEVWFPRVKNEIFECDLKGNVHPVNSLEGKASAPPKLNQSPLLPPT